MKLNSFNKSKFLIYLGHHPTFQCQQLSFQVKIYPLLSFFRSTEKISFLEVFGIPEKTNNSLKKTLKQKKIIFN